MRVIDKTGTVYKNTAWYAMLDPISGHVYQAGETVQVDKNPWLAGQPTMVEVPVVVPVTKPAEKPAAQPVKK